MSALKCWCLSCVPLAENYRMAICPDCGNKRCPKASDHRYTCTGSNEVGQNGSVYVLSKTGHSVGGANVSFTVGRIKNV